MAEVQSGEKIVRLLTIRETAELLRVSERTVYGLLDNRAIRRVRIGGATRIEHDEIVRYLDAQRETA